MTNPHPWQRQPYDSPASFNAFNRFYLPQDPPRSVNEAYRRYFANKHGLVAGEERVAKKEAPGTWQCWSQGKKHNCEPLPDSASWQQRALAFDDHLAELQLARWEQERMAPAEVLARLSQQARGSLGEFTDVLTLEDLADHPLAYLVKKLTVTVFEDRAGKVKAKTQIELHDAQSALVHLGKHYKLFTDNIDHKLTTGLNPAELSDEQLAAIVMTEARRDD